MSEFPILRSFEWGGPLRARRLRWELADLAGRADPLPREDMDLVLTLAICAVWGPAGVRAEALGATGSTLGRCDGSQLLMLRDRLAGAVTHGSHRLPAPPPQAIRTHLEAERLLRRRSGQPGVPPVRAALFSFHRSGWVREVATRHLASCGTGFELPFLLIRNNDWVEPVRAAAGAALDARLVPEYVPHLLGHLGLLRASEAWSRGEHAEYLRRVRALLLREEALDPLLEALADREHPFRRDVAQLAVQRRGEPLQRIVQLLARDRDPVLRFRAAQAAERAYDHEPELRELLERLSRDKFVPCASTALWLLSRRFRETAEPLIWERATSRSGSMRELARGLLAEVADADLPAFYFERIEAGGPRLAGALRGMSEVGEPADHELLLPFLKDPRPSVRSAALQGIARLDPAVAAPHLHAALQDRADSVAKTALRTLVAQKLSIRPLAVETLARYGSSSTVRQLAFSALDAAAPWRAMVLLIETWQPFQPQLDRRAQVLRHREQVVRLTLKRLAHVGSQPPPEQLLAIENALRLRGGYLGSRVLKEIGEAARMWRRLADAPQ